MALFPYFEIFDWLDQYDRPPRRVVLDKTNPFEAMTEREFLQRYRLSKESTNLLIQQIQPNIPTAQNNRGNPVPPHLQVLIALRYIGTGNHQLTVSDCADVSQSFVSNCVARIAGLIADLRPQWVKMPSGNEVNQVMQTFHSIGNMPAVLGCIDCTHIAINKPPGERSEIYRNRKGYFSLNVQAVCGPHLDFFNIVTRWHGSAHDSHIFDNSRLCQQLDAQERRYNTAHIKTRNTIERAFGVLKKRFCCLGKRMQTGLYNTKVIVVAAVVLHNIAVKQNIPMPEVIPNAHVMNLTANADPEDPDDPEPVLELEGNLQRNIVGSAERQLRHYF